MKVMMEHEDGVQRWLLTEFGDISLLDEYVKLAQMWCVYLESERKVCDEASGQFHLDPNDKEALFVITLHGGN